MKIIAHRGARGYEPENTLAAFQLALDMGAEGIELDIFTLKTGELVVIHDIMVNRTTNGSGYVEDFTFDEIRALDAGKGHKVPTLREAIELVDHKVPIIVELKAPNTALPLADLLEEYFDEGWQPEDFEVISFNHPEVALFHKRLPSVRFGISLGNIPLDHCQEAVNIGANSVMLCTEFLSPEFIQDAHDKGLIVHSFTSEAFNADTQGEIERIQATGVDSFCSDHPDLARSFLL